MLTQDKIKISQTNKQINKYILIGSWMWYDFSAFLPLSLTNSLGKNNRKQWGEKESRIKKCCNPDLNVCIAEFTR